MSKISTSLLSSGFLALMSTLPAQASLSSNSLTETTDANFAARLGRAKSALQSIAPEDAVKAGTRVSEVTYDPSRDFRNFNDWMNGSGWNDWNNFHNS